jgi:hypothetical protein
MSNGPRDRSCRVPGKNRIVNCVDLTPASTVRQFPNAPFHRRKYPLDPGYIVGCGHYFDSSPFRKEYSP